MMRGTLAMIGPDGRPSSSWSTIFVASRVSCRRTQQRAKLSPSGWVHTFQSTLSHAIGSTWSRRRSQSTPLARRLAPDRPYCRATSRGMMPTPRVRSWKISLPISRSSFSSQNVRIFFITRRLSSMKPLGRSSLSPPMRSKLGGTARR